MNTINNLEKQLAEYNAKRKTKLTASAIGWTLLIGELVITFFSLAIGIVFGLVSNGTEILSNSVFLQFLNVALTFVLFIIAPFICCRALNYKMRSIMPLHRVKPGLFIGSVLLGFGFNSVGNVLSSFLTQLFSMFGINPGGVDFELPTGFGGFIFSIICIAAVPALIEEFAFRGFALGVCRKIMPDSSAIFVSAFLFGVIHGNLAQIPFALCMGLVMGYITVVTNSVWPAIIVHFLNNAVSVVLDYAIKDLGPLSSSLISFLYLMFTAIFMIIGIMLLHKKFTSIKLNESKNGIPATKYIKWSTLSAGVICFVIFIIIEMIVFG